jgi:predicted nucleic acid-binding Zn ribbon protein
MAVVIRLCKHCQTPFPSKTQRALYCSHTCNKEYYRQQKRKLMVLPEQPQPDTPTQ